MLALEQCDNARSSEVWKALISSRGTEVGSGDRRQAASVALRITTLVDILVRSHDLRSRDILRERVPGCQPVSIMLGHIPYRSFYRT